MYLGQARELCPDLVVLQYDFEGYEEVSEQVADILNRHAGEHDGYVEQVSCDEAYMELYLSQNGLGSQSNGNSQSIRGAAEDLADTIRQEIFEATRCTATVGVAANKLMAKLAADRVKPNRSLVVSDARDLLKTLQLRDLHGVGYRLERKLAEENLVSIQDVWDLGRRGEAELCRILGQGLGKKVFGYCQGRDDRRLQPAERKTIGAECNYGVRFDGPYGVDHMIEGLAKEVEKRMTHVGVRGSKVTLKVKQRKEGAPPPPKFLGHGSCHNITKTLDTPNGVTTRGWECFFELGMKMFSDTAIPKEDVRGMGITVSKLVTDDAHCEGQANSKGSILHWLSKESASPAKESPTSPAAPDKLEYDGSREDNSLSQPTPDEAMETVGVMDGVSAEPIVDSSPTYGATLSTLRASEEDNDIALPALSQIHMSQVEELPSPIRRQVKFKIQKQKVNKAPKRNRAAAVSRDPRFRQTDVMRMMRLAAVKSGRESLPSLGGQSVSLTQLESLPLEMQLQVANEDDYSLGGRSPESKRKKAPPSSNGRWKSDKSCPPPADSEFVAPEQWTTNCDQPPVVDPCEFFLDNVRPLNVFMDENPETSREAVNEVTEFLSVCVAEDRVSDVVVLLRSIKNRTDGWGSFAFGPIFDEVNKKVEEQLGAGLDEDWIVQS
jgi:DNA repair protein REV1